jgi:hypothetical protein
MRDKEKRSWDTHDFKVKMLDWSASRGSRLVFTCCRCGRAYCRFAIERRLPWAVDGEGRALVNAVSDRWLSEDCSRASNGKDDQDRMRREVEKL